MPSEMFNKDFWYHDDDDDKGCDDDGDGCDEDG